MFENHKKVSFPNFASQVYLMYIWIFPPKIKLMIAVNETILVNFQTVWSVYKNKSLVNFSPKMEKLVR